MNAQSDRTTTVAHSVRWGEPLSTILAGVASLFQEGFLAGDAERIAEAALQLSPPGLTTSSERTGTAFAHEVRFQNRPSNLNIALSAVDIGYVDVSFHSPDTALITAVRSVIWKSHLASLSPVERVRVTVGEAATSHAAPTLVVAMETVRQYPCLGFGIDHAFSQRGDTLLLELFGVSSPVGICPTALGPALLRRELHLAPGRYALIIDYRGTSDRLEVALSDSSVALTTERSSFVEADERVRWRYPHRSFALYCQNVQVARPVCEDVRRWLARQPGISPLQFSPRGLNPYRPGVSNPDEKVAFFRYTKDGDLERVRRCFAEIETRIRGTVGVALTVQTWTGAEVNAWSGEAYDQPHVMMPGRVTAGPRCSGGP